MKPTIKDIARITGYSITTVSHVLNDKGDRFSDECISKIKSVVNDLGYKPNQLAVGLIKKSTRTIGFIISDIRNNFFSQMAKAVEEYCNMESWNMILCNTNDSSLQEINCINLLAEKCVDGIIISISINSNKVDVQKSIDLIKKYNIPYVMIDRTIENAKLNSVATDHIRGGYLAGKHLLEMGHRNIACITGPTHLNDSKNRLEGLKKSLLEYNITFNSELSYVGDYSYYAGQEAIEKFYGKSFTAIFAFNDFMAYGAYRALREKGYKIPEDVSIIGYDDIFFSEILDVKLSSIKQPIKELGALAAKEIIEMNNTKRQINRRIFLEPTLTIRDSVKKIKR